MPVGRERGNSAPGLPSIARDDPMPAGPYAIGLTLGPNGAEWPYTVIGGTGQAIAGHIHSKACAQAIVDALNRTLLP
jgi:hypothetical protein